MFGNECLGIHLFSTRSGLMDGILGWILRYKWGLISLLLSFLIIVDLALDLANSSIFKLYLPTLFIKIRTISPNKLRAAL